MESPVHNLCNLFQQLGLPAEPAAVDAFIQRHAPLPPGVALHEAPWWTPMQSTFLKDGCSDDSDWAEVIDQLNLALRGR